MSRGWIDPGRIDAHLMLRLEVLSPLPTDRPARPERPTRTVEDVFRRGLIPVIWDAPGGAINRRLDVVIDGLPAILPTGDAAPIRWGRVAANANSRRRTAEPIPGLPSQYARELLKTAHGTYLLTKLPFEDRLRRNDTHELLYFRDSGLHRRLIERTYMVSPSDEAKAAKMGVLLDKVRRDRLSGYDPRRWEAFVVVSIIDLVGSRCDSFAYRDRERDEIDLILEWRDGLRVDRWAIEVASRSFKGHPSGHFPRSCDHLGIGDENRYVVFRANACNGVERGRNGVRAYALPRMLDALRRRLRS